MNDYTTSWTLNGTEVLLQDNGRDKPNGVPVLDANAKIPTKYLNVDNIPAPAGTAYANLIAYIQATLA